MVFSAVSAVFLLHPRGILNTAVNNGSFEEAWDTIAKMEACLQKAFDRTGRSHGVSLLH